MFFFLLIAVPSIWFLELFEMERRINLKQSYNNSEALEFLAGMPNDTEGLHTKIEGLDVRVI